LRLREPLIRVRNFSWWGARPRSLSATRRTFPINGSGASDTGRSRPLCFHGDPRLASALDRAAWASGRIQRIAGDLPSPVNGASRRGRRPSRIARGNHARVGERFRRLDRVAAHDRIGAAWIAGGSRERQPAALVPLPAAPRDARGAAPVRGPTASASSGVQRRSAFSPKWPTGRDHRFGSLVNGLDDLGVVDPA
jgi:hypothetical protein